MLDTTVRARVDSNLKKEVEEILGQVGLTTSQAIKIFLNKVRLEKGIPFELKVPNKTTLNAMKEAELGIGEVVSFEDFMRESKSAEAV